ncbi:hypothetical protein ACH5RR_009964 [Cinchona calisaya]|uniref:Uncharacterized protein n=1 Tax=Cinchona calisaya TaxID=153742 RepID=A0ABD3AI69_9GENT
MFFVHFLLIPSMNPSSSNPQKKNKTTIPRRRGQIKAQIFEDLVETVSYVASKAGEILSKLKGVGDGIRSPDQQSTTPPSSAYTSDASPSHGDQQSTTPPPSAHTSDASPSHT